VVDDAFLMMQGVHTIAVKSRLQGEPGSEDRSPTLLEVRIDVDPPALDVRAAADGALKVDAWDLVSPRDALTARYRLEDGTTSAWVPIDQLAHLPVASGQRVTVEVKDEEGNVASKQQGLIRGRPDQTIGAGAESACGCSVPGADGARGMGAAGLVTLGLLGLALRSGRRKRARRHDGTTVLGSMLVLVLGSTWTGCSCSDDSETSANTTPDAGGNEEGGSSGACGTEGADPCVVLEPGLVGSYTSAAVAPDGTIWIAGYNEADWEGNVSYGDLVVGTWNGSSVDWEHIDGVPDEEVDDTVYDTESWRGGLDSAGPDVGQWTSLQLDESGHPRVAFWDVTNKALKFTFYDGSSWTTSTVFQEEGTQAGRYAEMLMIDGTPVIAFQVIESGDNSHATSKVVLARAGTATPSGPGDWTFEDVAVDASTPCRDHLCPDSQKCFLHTLQCAERTSDCDPKCASGTGCLNGSCYDLLDGTKLDTYPDAIGGYIAMAKGPQGELGIVYYDRIRGNLMQARQEQGAWVTALLDGQSADDPPQDTGDVGMGADLAIDESGAWHIAYVDGFEETLKYMNLAPNGTEIVGIEVADDGTGTDDGTFEDGRHVVGDDAAITVSAAGDVRIAYQDATAGTLRWTVGVPAAAGTAHTWSRKVIAQSGFGGFFPQQIMVDSSTQIVNWWRKGGDKIEGDVRVLSPN
ncbi:MAG: MYXO-CTERM sorting domain-containing protein, partial [Myxococcota bacterium]